MRRLLAWDVRPSAFTKVPPTFLRRSVPFRDAVRIARDHFWHGLLPRMLLFTPLTGGKEQIRGSVHQNCTGTVVGVVVCQRRSVKIAADMRARRSRTRADTMDQRVMPAEALLSMGEISGARNASEVSPVAPGTENALTNAYCRPPEPRDPIPEDILQIEPVRPFELDKAVFFAEFEKSSPRGCGWSFGNAHRTFAPVVGQH